MGDQYEEWQDEIARQIEASRVVGTCRECGGEIKQAEIEHGLANARECAPCVRDYVLGTIGDY
jgi:hypothetical protein